MGQRAEYPEGLSQHPFKIIMGRSMLDHSVSSPSPMYTGNDEVYDEVYDDWQLSRILEMLIFFAHLCHVRLDQSHGAIL